MTLRERGSGVKRAGDPSDIRGGKTLAAAVDVDLSPAHRAVARRGAACGRTEDAQELAVLADGVGGNFHYCALFLGLAIAKPELSLGTLAIWSKFPYGSCANAWARENHVELAACLTASRLSRSIAAASRLVIALAPRAMANWRCTSGMS